MFNVKSDKGVASVVLDTNVWFDVGVTESRELAAIEFPASSITMRDERDGRKVPLTVSITFPHADTMTGMALVMLEKTEPRRTFTAPEWLEIRDTLAEAGKTELADRIGD